MTKQTEMDLFLQISSICDHWVGFAMCEMIVKEVPWLTQLRRVCVIFKLLIPFKQSTPLAMFTSNQRGYILTHKHGKSLKVKWNVP